MEGTVQYIGNVMFRPTTGNAADVAATVLIDALSGVGIKYLPVHVFYLEGTSQNTTHKVPCTDAIVKIFRIRTRFLEYSSQIEYPMVRF